MKGIVVFNQKNDVVFLHCDESFRNHFNKKAFMLGIIQETEIERDVDPNVAVQLFSPLVQSQAVMMEHMQNPYHSITCNDGTMVVFEKLNDMIILGIGQGGPEMETYLHRKLLLLQRVMNFLSGPVTDQLRPKLAADRAQRWKFVANLLDTWSVLYQEEQAFLMEAVERLHVNQQLNSRTVSLLESAVSVMRTAGGEKHVVHALLLANAKLLSLYSTRNACELQAADILLITVLSVATFPSNQSLEDLFSQSYASPGTDTPPVLERKQSDVFYESATEENYDSDEVEYYTTPSSTPTPSSTHTPSSPSPASPSPASPSPGSTSTEDGNNFPGSMLHQAAIDDDAELMLSILKSGGLEHVNSQDSAGRTALYKAISNNNVECARILLTHGADPNIQSGAEFGKMGPVHAAALNENAELLAMLIREGQANIDLVDSAGRTASILASRSIDDSCSRIIQNDVYQQHTVFLATPQCKYSPHIMHCINVMSGVPLIILTEYPRAKQAGPLCQAMAGVKAILAHKETSPNMNYRTLIDAIDGNLYKLLEHFKKTRGSEQLADIMTKICDKWESVKSENLLHFLETKAKEDMPLSLERPLEIQILAKLRDLFRRLYLKNIRRPSTVIDSLHRGIEQTRQNVRRGLWDYKDLLAVKAQRNITITSYMDEFPGLVHFIYVNRSTHQMMAPSMNVSTEIHDDSMKLLSKIKQKVWQEVPGIQSRLQNGYLQQSFHHGDLLFSYYLWVEDAQGNQQSLSGRVPTPAPPPGVLSGNFYRQLCTYGLTAGAAQSLQCFELILVHVGLVTSPHIVNTNKFVQKQCRGLARKLWETQSEASYPISLRLL